MQVSGFLRKAVILLMYDDQVPYFTRLLTFLKFA
jgi:hypothetical protein